MINLTVGLLINPVMIFPKQDTDFSNFIIFAAG